MGHLRVDDVEWDKDKAPGWEAPPATACGNTTDSLLHSTLPSFYYTDNVLYQPEVLEEFRQDSG